MRKGGIMDLFTEIIKNVRDEDIPLLFKAVAQRYQEVFPDWSVTVITLEKTQDRNAQIDRIISNLQAIKSFPEE